MVKYINKIVTTFFFFDEGQEIYMGNLVWKRQSPEFDKASHICLLLK